MPKIEVKVEGEIKSRTVGNVSAGVLSISKKKANHLMRKFNAYGINSGMFSRDDIHTIKLKDDDGVYIIPVAIAKEKGIKAKIGGQDEQIFLPLDLLSEYKKD